MRDPIWEAKEQYRKIISEAMARAVEDGSLPAGETPEFNVEVPADCKNGDLATNAAMVSAKVFHLPPRKIAEAISAHISLEKTPFERLEIAGAGFINVFYSMDMYADIISTVLSEGDDFGKTNGGVGKKVMIEFVSANPTGPMHMGNARGGAIGDGLAAVFEKIGCDVTREFYINDAGNQIDKFGISLEARYLQIYKGEDAVEFPEEGYHGADIIERAKEFADIYGDSFVEKEASERRKALVDYALPKNIESLKTDLGKYRINYDVWFKESSLYKDGTVDKIVKILTDKGLTYEKDGALWYKNAQVLTERLKAEGKTDEQIEALELKDDVLIRANKNPTYFAGDIAYHYNKFAIRNYDLVINVWGADHHGHVARLKGAMDAVGCDGNKLDIALMQLVELMRNGKPERMSKRTGKAITLTDLLEEVPIDAARFFFNMREPNTHLIFDLGLAVEESSQNPVYYVQYAHARICSILRNLANEGITPETVDKEKLTLCSTDEEKALTIFLASYPGVIKEAAKNRDPARLTRYAIDLATAFHKFYASCRVKCDDSCCMQARISLCLAAKTVLANVLTLLKVDVPETM